jgi:hypothetical protein
MMNFNVLRLMKGMAGRVGQSFPESTGVVIAAGSSAKAQILRQRAAAYSVG